MSTADLVVCMTQDAMPADETLIEELVKPLMIRKSGQPMQDSFRTGIAERWKNTPEALTIRSRAW